MKKPIILAIMTCILVYHVSLAQSEQQKVTKRLESLRQVMEKPDANILADLASEQLEYVHSSGTVRNKQGFIDEFVKGWTKVSNVRFENQTITVTGDNAIVRHRMLSDFHIQGYPPKLDIIILMVWRKENDQWKLLARQAAKIPEN